MSETKILPIGFGDRKRPGKKGQGIPSRNRPQRYADIPGLSSPIAPVPPYIPQPIMQYNVVEPVKVATPDLVVTGEAPESVDQMFDLILQKIGGHELISISRSENVNGQNIEYQPIKNIGEIAREYDSKKIIPLPNSSSFYNNAFSINLESKIPSKGLGFTGVDNDDSLNIYVSYTPDVVGSTPQLIIEATNLADNELIQVEIIKSSDVFDDTIY